MSQTNVNPDDWTPSVEERDDRVTVVAAAALHGLFDADGAPPASNEPLPALWHWLAFLPDAPQRQLGSDGHAKLGAFMPPTPLPRRMFAGGRLEFIAPVTVEEPLHRRSLVTSVTKKSGRSGELLFVEVSHDLFVGARVVIKEVQNIVYREAEGASAPSPRNPAEESDELALSGPWHWQRELPTDPTVLFRFSALTYNAHRIHYDRHYATEVEGYPGLVVHGPLQAVALAGLSREIAGERRLSSFEFRARRPVFDGTTIQLRGRYTSENEIELGAFNDTGQLTLSATARVDPPGA